MGVPQGGIVSPLLSNLVLHELDLFILNIIRKKAAEMVDVNPYRPNPGYSSLTSKIG